MPMSRKTKYDFYNDQFKATAVELGALSGVKAKQVADILDIHPVMLYRWKKEYKEGAIMKKVNKGSLNSETQSELQRLKTIEKAHERLKQEHELLKKSIQFCSSRKKRSLSL